MTDANIDADIDITIKSLMRACRGNVANLPSFMVHDDHLWPSFRKTQADNRNRVHMRRSTFFRQVAQNLPFKPGVFLGNGVQHFTLDLKPHHLGGSKDMEPGGNIRVARTVTKADNQGRSPEDFDYADPVSKPSGITAKRDTNAVQLATGDRVRGVSSDALNYGDTEGS